MPGPSGGSQPGRLRTSQEGLWLQGRVAKRVQMQREVGATEGSGRGQKGLTHL